MQMLKEEHYFHHFLKPDSAAYWSKNSFHVKFYFLISPINPISYFCKQHLTQFAYENIPRFLPPFPFRNYLSINVNAFSLGFN